MPSPDGECALGWNTPRANTATPGRDHLHGSIRPNADHPFRHQVPQLIVGMSSPWYRPRHITERLPVTRSRLVSGLQYRRLACGAFYHASNRCCLNAARCRQESIGEKTACWPIQEVEVDGFRSGRDVIYKVSARIHTRRFIGFPSHWCFCQRWVSVSGRYPPLTVVAIALQDPSAARTWARCTFAR